MVVLHETLGAPPWYRGSVTVSSLTEVSILSHVGKASGLVG